MDGIVEQIIDMSHGVVSVVVNCFQYSFHPGNDPSRWIPARCGSRVVEASPESIEGLTQKPVHFSACTNCGAVCLTVGIIGDDNVTHMSLQPEDPRAKLLSFIISETENNGEWDRCLESPVRIIGMIKVHGITKMSETGSTCFNMGNVSIYKPYI